MIPPNLHTLTRCRQTVFTLEVEEVDPVMSSRCYDQQWTLLIIAAEQYQPIFACK